MKSLIKFFALAAVLVSAMACKPKQPECFIHYTADTLDAASIAIIESYATKEFLPRTDSVLVAFIEKNRTMTYEECSGTFPPFSGKYVLDSLYDENNFKTLTLSRPEGEPECNFIYIHGGGFFAGFGAAHTMMTESLLDHFNAKVYMPLYPLAPVNTVSTTMKMLETLYAKVIADGKPVYIMGDSAGGNITLCFTHYLLSTGMRMPDAIFPISPLCDYSISNEQIWDNAETDVCLTPAIIRVASKIWQDEGMAYNDPMVSPLHCEVAGFPPTLLFIADIEMLYFDCMLMYEKLQAAGVQTGILVGKGLWHIAVDFDIPAREQYLAEVAGFMK